MESMKDGVVRQNRKEKEMKKERHIIPSPNDSTKQKGQKQYFTGGGLSERAPSLFGRGSRNRKKEWSGSEEEPRYNKPQTVEFAAKMAEKMIASVAQKERRRRRRRPQVSKIAP